MVGEGECVEAESPKTLLECMGHGHGYSAGLLES